MTDTTPQNVLVLAPADTAQRWRSYVTFLIACTVVLAGSLIYICAFANPSYFSLLPLIASIYLLGSSLRGWSYMRSVVASVDGTHFVSVNWRGSVSKVPLSEIRKVSKSGRNLQFRDRWLKWWSGYLGGATTGARASFLSDFLRRIKSEYPAIEISFDLRDEPTRQP